MKRFFQSLFKGAKPDLLNPAAFTAEFLTTFQKTAPWLKIEIVKDFELKLITTDGRQSTSFLDNAYDIYKQDPGAKNDIVHRFVTAALESMMNTVVTEELDRTRIVPVIKDRLWLEETRKAMHGRGVKDLKENVYEDLNSNLVVLYAEDSPKNIRYFSPEDLEKAQIGKHELRALACENLKRLLPKIERHGANGLFMLTAGGDYESSLLLFDFIWDDMQKEVRGDVVVAIPTRELLLVTGSQDTQGIEKMKHIVQKATAEGSYRLTTQLFVFRDGRLEDFKQ